MLVLKAELPSLEQWRILVVKTHSADDLRNLHHKAVEAVEHDSRWLGHLEVVEEMLLDLEIQEQRLRSAASKAGKR
jgi:hypothetical protein